LKEVHSSIISMRKEELKHEFSDLFGKAGISWLKKLKLPSLDRLMLD
jgi:hypothetical protein